MNYISTNFRVNSSSRLPFRARTHRHKSTNATDHHIPRLVYWRCAAINSWHVAIVIKFIRIFSILVRQPAVCTSRQRSTVEISSIHCIVSLPGHVVVNLHRRYRPTNHSAAFSIYRPTKFVQDEMGNFVGRQCRPILYVRLPSFVSQYYRTIISADKYR